MAEALYRKYRPQTFDDVVGQTHIERTLKNAIEADKVSHAYLFCGPRGTGKTTTARLLAKALLCEHGPTPSPDGTCEQCQAIADGIHPDVNELDAASRTGVENVREEIIGRVQFAPTRGRYKVYIIDEVHMLSTAAFNALLKTLEEPPSHVVFILCTTDPQKVPETIHSRCQRFDFHRLSNEEIVSRLGAVCMAEGIEFEGEALDLVAHRAQGGMRDALTSLEQLAAFGEGKVSLEVAESVLGSLNTNDMTTIAGHLASRDAAQCFKWVSQYVETGADLAQFTRDLAEYVRNMYILLLTDGEADLGVSEASRQQTFEDAKLFGVDRLSYILGVLGDVAHELRASTNPRLSFEIALTRMVRPASDLTLEALAARIEQLEAQVAALQAGGVAVPAQVAVTAPTVAPTAAPVPAQPVSVQSAPAQSAPAFNRPMPQAQPAQVQPAQTKPAQASSVSQQSRPLPQAAKPASAPAAVSSQPAHPAPVATAPGVSGTASAGLSAKIANPASLQRGWQGTIAELKRQRAAYGALMLSAHCLPEANNEGVVIEFSPENTFAFNAVQKPDITKALADAFATVFGEAVPFRFAQGRNGAAVASAAVQPGVPMPTQAQAASAPAQSAPAFNRSMPQAQTTAPAPSFNKPMPQPEPAQAKPEPVASPAPRPAPQAVEAAPWEDDVVPYDDADVAFYAQSEQDDSGFLSASVPVAAPVASVGTSGTTSKSDTRAAVHVDEEPVEVEVEEEVEFEIEPEDDIERPWAPPTDLFEAQLNRPQASEAKPVHKLDPARRKAKAKAKVPSKKAAKAEAKAAPAPQPKPQRPVDNRPVPIVPQVAPDPSRPAVKLNIPNIDFGAAGTPAISSMPTAAVTGETMDVAEIFNSFGATFEEVHE